MIDSLTKKLILILLILLGISRTEILSAQCTDVTLSSQAEVNAFNCTAISGNLIIEGNDITDLSPLATGANIINMDIGGDIIIRNCPMLTTLDGVDIMTVVGGKFHLENLPEVTTFGPFGYSLQSCREFSIKGCPKLIWDKSFADLTSVSFFLNIEDIDVTTDMTSIFSNLNFAPNIRFFSNSGITAIPNFTSLTTTSSLVISDNSNMNVSGFSALTSTSAYTDPMTNTTFNGTIFITNNSGFIDISGFTSLNTMPSGSQLQVINNFSINNLSGFNALNNVGAILIDGNGVLDITGFTTLSSCTVLFIRNNSSGGAFRSGSIFDLSGFNNLSSVNQLIIENNIETEAISGFNGLASTPDLRIDQNSSLNSVTGFSNLSAVNTLAVRNNTQLSECCWILDLNANNTFISGNANGCQSIGQINQAPVFDSCPTSVTINTDSGSCSGSLTMADPNITDNCGYDSYTYNILSPLGNESGTADEGLLLDYMLPLGITTFTWTVTDESNNQATCITTITVIDNQTPEFVTELPTDLTISTNEGTCEATHSVIFPSSTDNCLVMNSSLVVYNLANSFLEDYRNDNPVAGTTYNIDLAPGEYQVEAFVDDGASGVATTTNLTVIDGTGPVISTSFEDITISCDEIVPNGPVAGVSVFSNDACDGNLSSNITIAEEVQTGSCEFGQAREVITYTMSSSDFSGNETEESYTVTIINDQQVDLGPDLVLCGGASGEITASNVMGDYTWSTGATSQTISVTQAGTYSVTVTGISGCCSIDEIVVGTEELPNISATGGAIGCSISSIMITSNSTTPGVSYSWTGPGGFSSSMQNPTVTSLGEYIVTASTSNGCESTATAVVEADTDVPDVSAEGGTITCATSEVQLMASSTAIGVGYEWTGPDGFTSTMQNPTTSLAGSYSVTVTAQNNCAVSADVEVIDDTESPNLVFEVEELNCTVIESTVAITGEIENLNFSWSGPDGFTSTLSSPTLTSPGEFSVTVTAPNQCTQIETFTLTQDIQAPSITVEGGLIDCSSNTITLMTTTADADLDYLWDGPDNFVSDQANPIVGQAGTYNLLVTAANGCTAMASTEVTIDENIPSISATGGIITCEETSVILMGSSETESVSFSWTGPNDFTSSEQNPVITIPGEYTLTVLAENGCSAVEFANVLEDTEGVNDLAVTIESSDCETNTYQVTSTFIGESTSILWEGPNGFTSTEQNTQLPGGGEYTIIVTSENGCTSSQSITLEELGLPDISASGNVLTCDAESVTISGSSDDEGVLFMWTGPGGFSSTSSNAEVTEVGTYLLVVTSTNGCTSSIEVEVEADANAPDIQVSGGNLDCNNDVVTLMGTSTTENVNVLWEGPNGFTSSDSNPMVTTSGTYTFTVSAENGCESKQTVIVVVDEEEPEITFSTIDINCDAGTLSIDAGNESIESYLWSGPGGFSSNNSTAVISEVGEYTLSVIGTNGCVADTSYNLENSISYLAEIETTPDTSEAGGTAEILITGGTAPYVILWDNGDNGMSTSNLEMGEHTVDVTDANGCMLTFTFTIDGPSNVIDLEAVTEVKVFPNPASHLLNIEWASSEEIHVIQLFSVEGMLLETRKVNPTGELSVDIEQYKSGNYFIRFVSHDSSLVRKFTKL